MRDLCLTGKHFKLDSAADNPQTDVELLGWNDLVNLKRSLSAYLKQLTDMLVESETKRFHAINNNIRIEKDILDNLMQRLKEVKTDIHSKNAELLDVSEKIRQSKNFLSTMQPRLPKDSENDLSKIVEFNQRIIDEKEYKNEREKNQLMDELKAAIMKVEAIKAIRTIRDQLSSLTNQSEETKKSIISFNEEERSLRMEINDKRNKINELFESKRQNVIEREKHLLSYNDVVSRLDAINKRLDMIAEMRKKEHRQFGHHFTTDSLLKAKADAKKKLNAGSKLSFEELKLLYSEDVNY